MNTPLSPSPPLADLTASLARRGRDRRVRTLAVLLFVGVVAMLTGVAMTPPPQAPLTVAIGPWLGYDPLVLLREQDRLPPSIRLVEMPSATDTQTALRDGRIDAAGVTLDEALRLQRHVPDLRVIAVLSDSRGADGIVLRAGVDPGAGLAGRRVLVEDSAAGGLMLAAALRVEGLQIRHLQPVQVRAQHLEARWAEGDADAIVCYEPLLSRLLAEGHVLLHSTREMPGLIYDVLVARGAVVDARDDDLQRVLALWEEGVAAFRSAGALPFEQLVPGTGLTETEYRRALAGIEFFDTRRSHALLTETDSELARVLPGLAQLLESRGEIVRFDSAVLSPAPQAALLKRFSDAR
jgi:NitT/TauT family transport system substrate-binding protein